MSRQSLKPGWNIFKFDEFVECVREQGQPTEVDSRKYIGLEHLDPDSLHVKRWGSDTDLKGQKLKMLKGDLLFAKRNAYLRRIAIAPHDGFFSAHGMVLRPKGKHILPGFLPFFLQSDIFMNRAIEISVGSLSPTINWNTLKVQEFPVPPIEEQMQIAKILWAVDEVIEHWRCVDSDLNRMLSVYREECFSRKNWPKKKLKNIYSVQLGKMLSPKAKTGNSSFPYLANYNVQWDRIDLAKVQEMDFSEKEREKFALAPGDILVCEGGEVGRCAVWNGEIDNCFYQKALHRLRPISNYSSEVMLQFMIWADKKGLFKALTGHSTIAHLTAVKLKEINVPVPTDKEQIMVEHLFSEMKSARQNASLQIAQTMQLKKSLSIRLLSNSKICKK